jgi:type IV pilus biogenesis protein CpaD/CtpE
MQTVCTMIGARRGIAAPALRAALVAAGALLTCGCNTTQQVAGVPEVPTDYRMRHPIAIREADRTLQMFIGSNRSELTPSQRAELLAFAQSWRREATGGVVVDLPVGGSNERAAADALREIQSIIVASGVPPQGVVVRNSAWSDSQRSPRRGRRRQRPRRTGVQSVIRSNASRSLTEMGRMAPNALTRRARQQ